jgi:tRNA(adenine34) deaminase
MKPSEIDLKMMRRCVELSAQAVRQNELPFSCVVCRDGEVVSEATNRVIRDGDVTRHAEILAISEAQRVLGRSDLSDCTLYSSVEPCPMCSFPIRETRIGRVVYSISSPMMGGFSKWNVLGDSEISNVMPQVFGSVPEVSAGLMYREAAAVWRSWNPLFWMGIRFRGCLAEGSSDASVILHRRDVSRSMWRRLLMFTTQLFAAKRPVEATGQPEQSRAKIAA